MGRAKIAISLDKVTLQRLDRLVDKEVFPNRSQAIESAVAEKLQRLDRSRLARECAKLDPDFEQALSDESLSSEQLGDEPAGVLATLCRRWLSQALDGLD